MKAKEFIPASKPRNFVAKNQKTAGAGAHKDKRKAEKHGDVKHKKDLVPMESQSVSEGSAHGYNVVKWYEKNGDQKKLTSWLRKEAGLEKNAPLYFDDVDLVHGDQTIVPGALVNPKLKFNDLLTAVVQATGGTPKQKVDGVYRSQDVAEYGDTAKGQKMLTKVQKRAVDRVVSKKADTDPKYAKKNSDTANRAWDRMTDKDESIEMERVRDPEDWDEGNTEPPNNFAVYINGKKWKVFKGRGQFADDYREMQQYRQLRTWAEKKSAETGKKWTVSVTGEPATESVEEGWKEKLGAAALAGSLAFGAAGAGARTLPGADPSINRLTGKPIATQQDTQQDKASDAKKDSGQQIGFSTEYLKKVVDGKHPRPMISVDDAKQELERRGEL